FDFPFHLQCVRSHHNALFVSIFASETHHRFHNRISWITALSERPLNDRPHATLSVYTSYESANCQHLSE
ncbi:unnamed protein product, partial [Ceratitis capitata]